VTALAAALAPSAKFISIKALSDTGAGDIESIARGIKSATQHQVNVILLPLGSSDSSPPIVEAVTEALKAGILVIAAAGNEGAHEPGFPARQDGVLPIGAIDQSGKKADFSNTGSHVLYAPGVNILVFAESGLVTQSGTSFSATVASAIAAVVWAAKPELSSEQILKRLNSTSVDLGPVDPTRPELGNIRRLDMKTAVSDFTNGSTQPPNVSGSQN
jgi:subtilisin family serine protease